MLYCYRQQLTQRVCFPRTAADTQLRFLAVKMKIIHPKFILPFGILIWYFSKVVDMSQPKKFWLTWDNLMYYSKYFCQKTNCQKK
jgi:hypothetical protein